MNMDPIIKNVLTGIITADSETIKQYLSVILDLYAQDVKGSPIKLKGFSDSESRVVNDAVVILAQYAKKQIAEASFDRKAVALIRSIAFGLLQGMEVSHQEHLDHIKEMEAKEKKEKEAAKERARIREEKYQKEKEKHFGDIPFPGHKPGTWYYDGRNDFPAD